jgi:cell division transport system permease protein
MTNQKRRKRKLGSFPFISVIFSITLSLIVAGIFGILFIYLNALTVIVQSNVEVQVYLDKSVNDSEILRLQKIIASKSYLPKENQNGSIKFISKQEAAEDFIKDTGEDFMEFLGDNPLRDVLIVKVNSQYHSLDSLEKIRTDINQLVGVFEVVVQESLVNSINKNTRILGSLFLGLTIILLIAVVILINNTIKIALFSQRFLIRSMQLVGATKGFIKWPFLKRALLYGLISGLLASAVLCAIIRLANAQFADLNSLYNNDQVTMLCACLVMGGMLLAYFSTSLSMNHNFKISLDELY